VIVSEANDNDALLIALVENLQRSDLNPLEEAEGYQMLADRFQMTQEQISDRVGKARASVANALRILALPLDIRAVYESLRKGSENHLVAFTKQL